MDRVDLLMVPLWKFAHGGLHVEICPLWTPCANLLCWTPCGNLLMVDSMWKSAHVRDSIVQLSSVSMIKSDEIIALCTLKIACTADIIHISVFCATIFSEYGLAAGLANF
ncbi:hypothetical protein [Paenibacillus odorifer]|uniref:hypothetical protein n=2 Tax=Paenibacillus TaxID=44249 RepID=UPI001C4BA894|nr:hypothetical protein [Paenibacillus odorifer]